MDLYSVASRAYAHAAERLGEGAGGLEQIAEAGLAVGNHLSLDTVVGAANHTAPQLYEHIPPDPGAFWVFMAGGALFSVWAGIYLLSHMIAWGIDKYGEMKRSRQPDPKS